jgi:S-adenosylmethionine-diacylglycerol 3-amino-3-carboxypropyl transferase
VTVEKQPAGRGDLQSVWAAGALGRRGRGGPEVVFAQVREDVAIETALFARCEPPATAFCIAAGGCTAFSLLTAAPAAVHAVDINPAQVYLLELKEAAFGSFSYEELLHCLTGDAREAYARLRERLTPEAREFWDLRPHALAQGLNRCGALDRRLAQALRLGLPLVPGKRVVMAMFGQEELEAQREFYRRHWDTHWWRMLIRVAMSRPVLGLLWGRAFLDRLPAGYVERVKEQVDAAFLETPIGENGPLWQTFLGHYPIGEAGLPPYLQREQFGAASAAVDRLHVQCADAAAWLERQPSSTIDFFALSNILELTTRDYAARLAKAILHSAKPGALACLRSIFPPDPDAFRGFGERLIAEDEIAAALSRTDRSPFCRFLQVLRVND